MNTINSLVEALLLSLALSADALSVGLSYGASRVKVSPLPAIVMGAIGSGVLAFSMFSGDIAEAILPVHLSKYISFFILAALGLVRLANLESGGAFADCDNNKRLSIKEAFALSAALSLDSLAAGFSVGLSAQPIFAIPLTLVFSSLAIFLGAKGGAKLIKKGSNAHRFFGLILIALAITKII